ncbi:nitrate- and nitrite sensing domain-containing protein [Dactylosporangium salmoneum]|uniref:histidine kinase n=2 Tax=Dactylosporangium salmoneum TaxID=53361 RepID=A0ABN3HPE1_9ACTN
MTVPLVMLVALWLFAVSLTLPSALDLRGAATIADRVGEPGEAMVVALQSERQLTGAYLSSGRKSGQQVMLDARKKSDEAIAAFRRLSSSGPAKDVASDELVLALDTTYKALDGVAGIRQAADAGGEPDGARNGFNQVIMTTYGLFEAAANHADSEVAQEARGAFVLSMARELLSEEDTLVGDFTTEGDYTVEDFAQLVTLVGQSRLILPYASTQLRAEQQVQYRQLAAGAQMKALQDVENRLMAATPGKSSGVELAQWRAAFDPVNAQLAQFRSSVQKVNVRHASEASDRIVLQLVVAGVVGLLAVVASVLLSVRTGRSVARRLDGLRVAARELAEQRLPSVVSRLRKGTAVDVAAEAPPLRLGSDEIGQVAEAFNSVQRTAVASAVDEASVRQGMNEVFLNIARRSQTLLHRQLQLLDGMERRTSEPDDLADLFRVDHLATRMRRHAEDLVILAGSTPGRGWRNPVPVIDVVRGAVSEVEDYARVQVLQVGEGAVVGRAVGDVIHLLAELLENATAYSPPHTRVQVTGQSVPNGFVVEIEDRGLGMTVEAVEEANRRLAEPPDFDPANSARLGLFVVAQLAARHRVKVMLRPSPYGGVTAVALLPMDLVVAQSSVLPAGAAQELRSTHELPMVAAEPFSWLPGSVSREVRPEARQEVPQGRPALSVVPEAQPRREVPRPPVERSEMAEREGPGPARGGLPKRVRQQSLAPQLQTEQSTASAGVDEDDEPTTTRSPEQLRRMMSSFQAGTARGRHASQPADGDGVDGGQR